MAWITTSNVSEEAWRYVLEFANLDLAIQAISGIHGPNCPEKAGNYKKQAQQIRVALIQAAEYFDAAKSATLATSPNHLYYGMVSLSTAVMLLYGDGTKALDQLRKEKKNSNHGLEFSTAVTSKNCHQNLTLLQESRVTPRTNGHFINWYSTLPSTYRIFAEVTNIFEATKHTNRLQVATEKCATPDELTRRKWAILDLLQYLPDLRPSLERYGVSPACSRVNYSTEIRHKPAQTAAYFHKWVLHSAGSYERLLEILDQFRSPVCNALKWECVFGGSKAACTVTFNSEGDDIGIPGKPMFQWSSTRCDMNQDMITYAKPLDTPEFVDAYLCAYGLSMLARYFPDIWITCLESHCKAAKIIERLVDTLIAKAPLMTAGILANEDLVIATHRPPWYT